MKKLFGFALAAALGACASNSAERRPAATAETEPAPHHHARHTEQAVEPVTPATERMARERDVSDVQREHGDAAPVRGPDADNTGHNARDRSGVTPTPLDQGNNSSDLEYTQKIRRALMQDDHLSSAAKNVKVVSERGQVTLRGTVKDEAEKRSVEKYAREVVGPARVNNQLDVEQ